MTKNASYLFVLPWSLEHPGGVNQVVINLARSIHAVGGLQPIVLISDWNSPKPVWGESHGLKTVRWRVRPYHADMGLKERLAYRLWERRFKAEFQQFCRDNRVAAINPHYPCESTFALERIVRGMPSPPRFVLSFHGTDVDTHRRSNAMVISGWKKLLQESDGVIACSQDLVRTVREVFGTECEAEVIHNGVDPNNLVPSASTPHVDGRRTILNIGKFDKIKGQDILIKAYASLAADYPDVDLVLVGASGPALPDLRSLCTQLGIDHRISFHQDIPHAKIGDFFARATLFVLPSRREALGIAILEAGCFGLPVIASRVGGIPEIIENERTGKLVAPDMPNELANSIRSMLDHPSEAAAMGHKLKETVESKFTWTACARKYLKLIEHPRAPGLSRQIADR